MVKNIKKRTKRHGRRYHRGGTRSKHHKTCRCKPCREEKPRVSNPSLPDRVAEGQGEYVSLLEQAFRDDLRHRGIEQLTRRGARMADKESMHPQMLELLEELNASPRTRRRSSGRRSSGRRSSGRRSSGRRSSGRRGRRLSGVRSGPIAPRLSPSVPRYPDSDSTTFVNW